MIFHIENWFWKSNFVDFWPLMIKSPPVKVSKSQILSNILFLTCAMEFQEKMFSRFTDLYDQLFFGKTERYCAP